MRAMRDAIRRHAHTMQYSAVDTSALHRREAETAARRRGVERVTEGVNSGVTQSEDASHAMVSPDAFEVMLEGAYAVSRDSELQALGRTLQRSRRGALAVAQRRHAVASSVQPGDRGPDLGTIF